MAVARRPLDFSRGFTSSRVIATAGFLGVCEALEDWAADLGCIEFASDVLVQNALGQRVHEALGFVETERVVFYAKRLA